MNFATILQLSMQKSQKSITSSNCNVTFFCTMHFYNIMVPTKYSSYSTTEFCCFKIALEKYIIALFPSLLATTSLSVVFSIHACLIEISIFPRQRTKVMKITSDTHLSSSFSQLYRKNSPFFHCNML